MGRKQEQQYLLPLPGGFHRTVNTFNWTRLWRKLSANRFNLLLFLIIIALAPPAFFHFRLGHYSQVRTKTCGWLSSPPLVCAHGGDSINAFPNTMAAYRSALRARVDCIEIDVSRSGDGVLFALHDRDLQRVSGNSTARVGHWSKKDINKLDGSLHFPGALDDKKIPTVEDALTLVSSSVRLVILDAKVGPPLYEKGLADDILAVVNKLECFNCIVWAKSDPLVREIIELSPGISVGYIITKGTSTWSRSNVLRMKSARVAGVHHPLIDEKLVQTLHGSSKKVFAWTVDDMVSMRDMLSNQVDAVVTSNPALFQQVMDETRIRCLEEEFLP